MRLIDADMLLAWFESWNDNDEFSVGYIKGLIEEAEKAGPWIPCSERLPNEDGQYLITVKYKHVDGYEDVFAEHSEWYEGSWDMFYFGHCGEVESVLAWQPLPEPWKGEK